MSKAKFQPSDESHVAHQGGPLGGPNLNFRSFCSRGIPRMCKETFVLIPSDKEIHAIIQPSLLIVDKSWQIAFTPELISLFSGEPGQQGSIYLLVDLL